MLLLPPTPNKSPRSELRAESDGDSEGRPDMAMLPLPAELAVILPVSSSTPSSSSEISSSSSSSSSSKEEVEESLESLMARAAAALYPMGSGADT